jgi:hypothetical protein
MPDLEAMKRDLLAELRDDHVGLWSVIRYVEDEFPQESPQRIRQIALDLLYGLLKSGRVWAGFPDSNGVDFHAWPFAADVIVDHIKRQWPPAGPRPNVGEVAWFTSPSTVPLSS